MQNEIILKVYKYTDGEKNKIIKYCIVTPFNYNKMSKQNAHAYTHRTKHIHQLYPASYTPLHTPTWPGIQSEDTIYTRVYSVFVPAFKARTNLCITHSKWGHFFTHLWTCLARTKRGLRPYPPTPILWQREDSAHSHKARTEILTSLCQNVLTLNVKNWFWSSLWMPCRTPVPPTHPPPIHSTHPSHTSHLLLKTVKRGPHLSSD